MLTNKSNRFSSNWATSNNRSSPNFKASHSNNTKRNSPNRLTLKNTREKSVLSSNSSRSCSSRHLICKRCTCRRKKRWLARCSKLQTTSPSGKPKWIARCEKWSPSPWSRSVRSSNWSKRSRNCSKLKASHRRLSISWARRSRTPSRRTRDCSRSWQWRSD